VAADEAAQLPLAKKTRARTAPSRGSYYSADRGTLRTALDADRQQSGLQRLGAILKDPMATAAAIDRLVHHAAILEFNDSRP